MSHPKFPTPDLCPVCLTFYLERPMNFCSDECASTALKMKKRLERSIYFIRELGFGANWTDTLELTLTLPNDIDHLYPRACKTWKAPMLNGGLDLVNSDYLFRVMSDWLGSKVAAYCQALNLHTKLRGEDARETLYTFCKYIHWNTQLSFVCDRCHVQRIMSSCARPTTLMVCADCVKPEDLPF